MPTLARGVALYGSNRSAGEMNYLLMSALILVGTELFGVVKAVMSLTLLLVVEVNEHTPLEKTTAYMNVG